MDLNSKYPAISDLRSKARKRIPHFAWEYLDSATGDESTLHRNRSALDAIQFVPRGLRGEIKPQLAAEFLGKTYSAPFGIAPVGMSGLMWPGAEKRWLGLRRTPKFLTACQQLQPPPPKTLLRIWVIWVGFRCTRRAMRPFATI